MAGASRLAAWEAAAAAAVECTDLAKPYAADHTVIMTVGGMWGTTTRSWEVGGIYTLLAFLMRRSLSGKDIHAIRGSVSYGDVPLFHGLKLS
jgi:hypothetical protein